MRALLLDVGGVLVVPRPERLAGLVTPYGGLADAEELIRAHYRAIYDADSDAGFDWPGYHRSLLTHCGVADDDHDSCFEGLAAMAVGPPPLWSHVLPGVADALRALAGRYRLGIVSNNDGTVAELLAELKLCQLGEGPAARVEVIIDSALVGLEKPDPRIFDAALDVLGLPADQVGYVGDTLAYDVAGARAAGLRPFHVDPYGLCVAPDHEHVTGLPDLVN